ncbi:hypothetical protein LZ30DRAFT_1178 [Colletotrichum cereale]|nr:hypothetical protein LZ30DRAFT_1178 [Colletotrichum cereale]
MYLEASFVYLISSFHLSMLLAEGQLAHDGSWPHERFTMLMLMPLEMGGPGQISPRFRFSNAIELRKRALPTCAVRAPSLSVQLHARSIKGNNQEMATRR